jgi:hypothetical protein
MQVDSEPERQHLEWARGLVENPGIRRAGRVMMRSAMAVLIGLVAALGVLAGVRFQVQMARAATGTDMPKPAFVGAGRTAPGAAVPAAAGADASLPLPRQTLVARLLVLDVAEPLAPRPLARTEPRAGENETRALAGKYWYSVDKEGSLTVRDVDDPAETVFPDHDTHVAVVDHYAYVAAGPAGLRIMDLTAPAETIEVGYYKLPGEVRAVVARGGCAYLAILDEVVTRGYD